MRKTIILLISTLISFTASAQFSYSVMAGANFTNMTNSVQSSHSYRFCDSPTFTVSAYVNYDINGYLGLKTGIKFLYLHSLEDAYVADLSQSMGRNANKSDYIQSKHTHGNYLQIPLLFRASTINIPKSIRAIWEVGPFGNILLEQDALTGNWASDYKSYWGIMASCEIEILSHYIVRGEYQWGMSGTRTDNVKIKVLSVAIGYQF